MLDYFTLCWCASFIAVAVIVWFESAAFIEYAEFFGIDGYLGVKDFKKAAETNIALTYHEYLLLYRNNFFTRLISCSLCSTIWLCIFTCLKIGFVYFPFLVILSYSIYGGVIKLNERS